MSNFTDVYNVVKKDSHLRTKKGRAGKVFTISRKDGDRMDKDEVRQRVLDLKRKARKDKLKGTMMVSLHYDKSTGRSYSGKQTDFYNDEVPLHDPSLWNYEVKTADQDSFQRIVVYVIPSDQAKSGASESNDCVWEAINKIIGAQNTPWPEPEDLKKFLGLKRKALIPNSRLKDISNALKCDIHVLGDNPTAFTDSSNTRLLRLRQEGEHVTGIAAKNQKRYKVFTKRKLVVFGKDPTLGKRMYDEDGEHPYDKQDDNIIPLVVDDASEMKAMYDKYMDDADSWRCGLRKHSQGLFPKPLYIPLTEHTAQDVVLALFWNFTKSIPEPPQVEELEAHWLAQASLGGVMYAKPGVYKNASTYDYVSFYPSLMNKSTGVSFPRREGKYQTLTKRPECWRYGIYRVRVKGDHPYFRFNKCNYYTHTDLVSAESLGLETELITDGATNALIYDPSYRFNGRDVFGPMIDMLFAMKQQKYPFAKFILNSLWGQLCRFNRFRKFASEKRHINPDMYNIVHAEQAKDHSKFDVVPKDNQYKYGWARMKPFLLALGRSNIVRETSKYGDRVVRIQTDGFIATGEVQHAKMKSIGLLIKEKTGTVTISHVNDCVYEST